MKTKYVCHSLISLYVNFHNNRTIWSTNLHVKFCRWGGGGGGGGGGGRKKSRPFLLGSRNQIDLKFFSL